MSNHMDSCFGCGLGYISPGFPSLWGLLIVLFILFLVIGYCVYRDANKQGKNGLLWGILTIIPVVGIVVLIV
jgi:putative membrane protein